MHHLQNTVSPTVTEKMQKAYLRLALNGDYSSETQKS